jgi:hypothetical protein
MKQKSKTASISDRLSLIETTNGFEAESRLVADDALTPLNKRKPNLG